MACVAGFQTQEWRGRKSGGDACRKDQPWTVLPGGLAIRRGEQCRKESQVKGESVSCSVVSDSYVTPWTAAHQAPLCMEFCTQEHWSGWPFPSPGDRPDPEIEPGPSALQADSSPPKPPGKPPAQWNAFGGSPPPCSPSMVLVHRGSVFVGFCPCYGPWSSLHALLPPFPGKAEGIIKKKCGRKINNSLFS